MTSLQKRIAYLGIADFDYLSARLLLLYGLAFAGLPKAAESFEKLLKLFLLLEAKIAREEELTPKQLKAYGHDLPKLFAALKEKVPAKFGSDWDDLFALLQDSYDRRYPEHWREFRMEVSVHSIDIAYTYLRNNVVPNFPVEEQGRVRQFGTFIYAAYTPAVRALIERLGGRSPGDVLRLNNQSFESLDIDPNSL